jgi:MoaA/NifB/PqqE/SkfB family radical SAM enzyme
MTHRHVTLICHPIGLLIDPSNGCRLRCPGCVHSGKFAHWDWPSGILKESVYRAFINEHGPFANEIYFANYGEPLLSSLTPHLVRVARQFGLPSFTSSSLSVPPKMTQGVVESGINFIICSIDGASPEVYEKYRRQGNFDQVMANLRTLIETKRRLNSYTPVLHWQFLVFQHNRHEVDAVTKLAKEVGVNQIALTSPFDVSWDDASIKPAQGWESETIVFDHDVEAYRAGLSEMLGNFDGESISRHFGRSWSDRLASHPEIATESTQRGDRQKFPRPCNWLYTSLTMDSHGRVMPCARPPSKSGDLVFTDHTDNDTFNSSMQKLRRLSIIDEAEYQRKLDGSGGPAPYCAKCEHRDQKGDIDTSNLVRRLLEDFSLYGMLDTISRDALTNW